MKNIIDEKLGELKYNEEAELTASVATKYGKIDHSIIVWWNED